MCVFVRLCVCVCVCVCSQQLVWIALGDAVKLEDDMTPVASQILRVDKGRIGEGKIVRTNGF